MDQQHAIEIEVVQRIGVDLTVLHEHQAGLDQVEDVFQLGVILAHHRVGRRHRRERRARLHRGHRQQRELDRVRRQDHDRLVRPEAAIEQRLRHRIDLPLGLAVGHLQPVAPRPAALRQPHAIGRLGRPLREERRHVLLVGLQRVVRLQDDRAVGAAVDGDVAAQEVDRLERRLHHTVQRRFPRLSSSPDLGRVPVLDKGSVRPCCAELLGAAAARTSRPTGRAGHPCATPQGQLRGLLESIDAGRRRSEARGFLHSFLEEKRSSWARSH